LNYDFDIRTADGTLVSQPLATASSETTQTAAGRKYYRKIMNAGTYYIRVFARTGYGNRAYEVDLNISLSNTLHVLSVPSIAQKQSKWCWAAASEMLGKWIFYREHGYDSETTRNQIDCVRLIKHNNDQSLPYSALTNQGGSDAEYQRALNYVATGNQNSTKFTASRPMVYSISQIDSRVFEWSSGVAIAITGPDEGHALVLKGCRRSDGTIVVGDPGNPANMTEAGGLGITRNVLYNDLVINGYLTSDTRTYQMTIIQNN
jgi:hypothetical protein